MVSVGAVATTARLTRAAAHSEAKGPDMSSLAIQEYEWDLTLEQIRNRIPDAAEILERAVVLRIGWEMDNEVCAVRMNDGSKILVGTNHGGVYEIEESELREDMQNYRAALEQSDKVLAALR